ncbi:hypothetical protein PV326_007708 [Microctonus aethiopoides]|nr:hypothetical protein PV326_007708 [Microctonus aethiopoides]
MADALPEVESNFWTKGRLKSYEHWPYQSSEFKCNPEHMAAAGFICVGGVDEPDLVECFICSKQLDGWDSTDDPWQEHKKHQANCPYILLNKNKEEMWTIDELYTLVKQYHSKECARKKEMIINDFKAERDKLSAEIPIIYKNTSQRHLSSKHFALTSADHGKADDDDDDNDDVDPNAKYLSENIPLLPKWPELIETGQSSAIGLSTGLQIQQRWVFAIMGFLAIFNAYTMRVCLSITITEMVIPVDKNESYLADTCPNNNIIDPTAVNSTSGTYEWDESLQGLILSSFYWGYVLTHLPGGILAEKFGGKYSLGLGILSTAIFTLITPVVVEYGGAYALIVVRVLMGAGEGTTFPALNAMLAQWTPPEERSKIGSLVFAGALLGTVFTSSVSGVILHYSTIGWPAVFYVFGSVGVLWFLVWIIVCYNNPSEHPFISESELKYLNERLSAHTHKKPPPVPWKHVFTSKPLWALIAAQIGHDWGFFTMVTDLPKYMSSVLKFPIKSNGYLSSLPYLCMWVSSIFSSWMADWIITAGHMSRTNIRKIGTTIASIGPGVFIIAASYAGCDGYTVVAMFTIGMTLMGTFYPGMKVNALDLSPNYAGTLMAVVNGIGAFTGILTPLVVGELTPDNTNVQWRLVFWIVFVVLVITNLIFIVYASGEVEYWNDPEFVIADQNKKLKKLEGEIVHRPPC